MAFSVQKPLAITVNCKIFEYRALLFTFRQIAEMCW
jgi:hypothetical protein